MNNLLHHFINNNINLVQIFATELKSKSPLIKVQQLKELCTANHYRVNPGDWEIVLRFFKPPEAKDEAKKDASMGRRGTSKSPRKSPR